MVTLAAVVSFFTLHILVSMTNANGNLVMKVHPSQISLGLSSSLDINCSFSSMDHPEMAEFASLILSKANLSGEVFEDAAAVTQFTPDSVNVLTHEKIAATGVHNQSGETFIHLSWQYPTQLQSGVYKCTAYGLDILGECLEVVSTYIVTADEADLNDIFEILKQVKIHGMAMENKMASMEKHIEVMEYNNSQMSSYITDQDNTIANMEKNIQDLQNNNSQVSSYITDQDNTIGSIEKNIQDLQNNNSQMSSNITDQDKTIASMEKNIQDLENKNAQMSSNITDQDNTIASMEKNIQDLENKNEQMSSNITDLQDTVTSLQCLQRIDYLGTYQDHDYYISKEAYGKINYAMDVCKSCGGYLTEIDNQNEFSAIKPFLDLTSGFIVAMIAGTDEAVDGTWILQSNQQPLPFTSWLDSDSSTGTGHNCLALARTSWNMDDYRCNYDPPEKNMRFTCEIPRV